MRERLWGRDSELALIDDALDGAASGRPAAIVFAGDPGIGKTSLLRAAAENAPTSTTVLWARGMATGSAPPFGMWRQALGSVADTGSDRFALFEELRDRVRALSPNLLLIDDIQWVDEPSLRGLTYLIRRFTDDRTLVIASLRTDTVSTAWQVAGADLLAEMAVVRIDLSTLGPEDSQQCLDAASRVPLAADAASEALRLARGNPFYLKELGRAWSASPGRDVPRSISAIVGARLARLSGAAQEFLLATSVIGEEAEIAVVARCLDRPASACLGHVQEAFDAQLAEAGRSGMLRFTHGLVRSALLKTIPVQQRVALHRRAAGAIESLYADGLEPHLADLARHWAEVAVAGDSQPAAVWAERAALAAMRELAYEDAARLAQLALDVGGPALDDGARARLLQLLAAAQRGAGRLREAFAACRTAMALALGTDDTDLLVRAALTVDPVGERARDRELEQWCVDALRQVPAHDTSVRARLSARRSDLMVYTGAWHDAVPESARALELAEAAADDEALIAALRARQLALAGAQHRDDRLVLAARMSELGQRLNRPDVEMWGRLWTIDALFERARLSDIAAELNDLRYCTDRLRSPVARWHYLICAGALAQARGSYADALQLAQDAFDIARAVNLPAGFGAYLSLLSAVGHHVGHHPMALDARPAGAPDEGEVNAQIFFHIGPAFALADTGRLDEARVVYRRAGPPSSWRLPPFFDIAAPATAAHVAAALGLLEDVVFLRTLLLPHRAATVVTSAGSASYLGPVELTLGRCAVALGELEEAQSCFESALRAAIDSGTPGFEVEAEYELARVLQRRHQRGDAAVLLGRAEALATELRMTPWLARIGDVRGRDADVLTAREREVASFAAAGRSNREIAQALVLSERTVANHVQHVLDKLGFARRSQIAAWMAGQTAARPHGAGDVAPPTP